MSMHVKQEKGFLEKLNRSIHAKGSRIDAMGR
jgi:hypothetical protein